jgi:hypothetical protein
MLSLDQSTVMYWPIERLINAVFGQYINCRLYQDNISFPSDGASFDWFWPYGSVTASHQSKSMHRDGSLKLTKDKTFGPAKPLSLLTCEP